MSNKAELWTVSVNPRQVALLHELLAKSAVAPPDARDLADLWEQVSAGNEVLNGNGKRA